MSEPIVCAIMLTRDRPEMAQRAIESFRAQTYLRKRLLVTYCQMADLPRRWGDGINVQCVQYLNRSLTIGAIRNMAISEAAKSGSSDIIVHFDDDDWSDPNRIAEQVALLQASGADCVGYREMLFWRTLPQSIKDKYAEVLRRYPPDPNVKMPAHLQLRNDQAWIYSAPSPASIVGSSLCYWRATWEAKPFPDLPKPDVKDGSTEDTVWLRGLKCTSGHLWAISGSRMICAIHGANTQAYDIERYPESWRRAPEWDAHCAALLGGGAGA